MTGLSKESTEKSLKLTPFKFTGDGFEYFKICIVNVMLTIITLGIYSAWATVRNNKYLYSNLHLEDNNFRYLADPIEILKGRIIAIIAVIVYVVIGAFSPLLSALLGLILLVSIPYFYNQSLAFKMRMTAYKNIQFRFKGTYEGTLMILFVWPMLSVLTLGILLPKAIQQSNEYIVNSSSYGTSPFKFHGTYKDYGLIFLMMLAAIIAFAIVVITITVALPQIAIIVPLLAVIFYLGLIAFFMTATVNLFYQRLSLVDHEFDSQITLTGFIKVALMNLFLIVITFGLYAPAAHIRMLKYFSENIAMKVNGNLDDFSAAETVKVSALGEEMGQAFDFT